MSQSRVSLLDGKRIALGVTGSIAVYKAVDLASKLTQAGAQVDVIMTDSAERFVNPLTFQAVTGRPVYDNLWSSEGGGALPTHIAHVGLGESADVLIAAPATANLLAKFAAGLADDLLSVTYLAARCPVVVAPAMDGGMYGHPVTTANLAALREQGVTIIEPEEGRFASGLAGKGRLPDTPTLIGHVRQALGRDGGLSGLRVLVTAGGTREALDPVRYITNHSSGKQGYALAQAAIDAGAAVTLVSAARDLTPPVGAELVPVDSARDMLAAVEERAHETDVLLMAAAVGDYRPATASEHKIKKSDDPDQGMMLDLARNPDILARVKGLRANAGSPRIVVGFAAESQDLLANASSKLERKGMDLIVANDISDPDAGFRADTNRVILLDRTGTHSEIGISSKSRIAEIVIERVVELMG